MHMGMYFERAKQGSLDEGPIWVPGPLGWGGGGGGSTWGGGGGVRVCISHRNMKIQSPSHLPKPICPVFISPYALLTILPGLAACVGPPPHFE